MADRIANAKRSHLLTVVAVAFLAYAFDDLVHEVLGHGVASVLSGVQIVGLSSIGLQTAITSRAVASAGAIANLVAGLGAAVLLARRRTFALTSYFLWLFAFVNLMNGTGYLMASALLNFGDWAVVIAGREPAIAWRFAMGVAGVASFAGSVRWAAGVIGDWVAAGEVAPADLPRLTAVPYLAGGLLFVAASLFNPVGPSMILGSGVAASFGLTFGLLIVLRGASSTPPDLARPRPLPLHWGWIAAGFAVAAGFVFVLGPGIRF